MHSNMIIRAKGAAEKRSLIEFCKFVIGVLEEAIEIPPVRDPLTWKELKNLRE